MSTSTTHPPTKPIYLLPRIALLPTTPTTHLPSILTHIETYHGKYFHLFNLTNSPIFGNNNSPTSLSGHQTRFKWRGVPFSVTEGVRVLTKLDQFLRSNKGNVAVFCVSCEEAILFVEVLVREYLLICQRGLEQSHGHKASTTIKHLTHLLSTFTPLHPLFSHTLHHTYTSHTLTHPPVKILCSLQLSTPHLIPTFQIYQQARYNDFQMVYSHEITNQLAQYYFNLNKPLEGDCKSIGKKFYDRRPETKYLKRPVTVCGDVKVVCYSYETLEKRRLFSFGFNTRGVMFSEEFGDNGEGVLTFTYKDLYEIQPSLKLFDQTIEIYIRLQNECPNTECATQSKCQECQQHCKKLNLRYNQTQIELNVTFLFMVKKLCRERTVEEVRQQFSV